MKKILLLIVLLIFLTGCTAEVNVEITADEIYEEINITAYASGATSKDELYTYFRKFIPVYKDVNLGDTEPDIKKSGVKYYTRGVTDIDNGYVFQYFNYFQLDDYNNARSLGEGFASSLVQNDTVDKEIMITTDNGGLKFFDYYPDLESVKINVTSLCEVKESNADSVEGNVYTWNLNKNTKKGIYILYSTSNCKEEVPVEDKEEKKESKISKFANSNPILVGLIAFVVFFIVILILGKMNRKIKK